MQIAKHSLIYFAGRILPAAIAFGGIALYTRLVDPASMGQYAVLLSISLLVSALAFGWLRTSALRMSGSADKIEPEFAATMILLFLATSAVVVLAEAFFLRLFYPSLTWLSFGLTLAVAIVYGWFDLTTVVLQARMHVVAYGAFNFARAITNIVLSLVLIRMGLKSDALLAGFVLGCCTSLGAVWLWRPALTGSFDRALAGRLVRFGWPSIFSAMTAFTTAFQRYWLDLSAGAAAVGIFAVSTDLSAQTVWLLIGVTSLAGRPLAFKAADLGDPGKLAKQLRENAQLIFGIALPSAVGLAVLAGPVAHLYLGSKFRTDEAVAVIALGSISVLLAGLRDGYFDQAFEIALNLRPRAVIDVVRVAVGVVASVFLIRAFGAVGAASASLLTNAVGLILSACWGSRLTAMPLPLGSWLKTALATAGMVLVIQLFPAGDSLLVFGAAVAAGAGSYIAISALTQFAQVRALLRGRVARLAR